MKMNKKIIIIIVFFTSLFPLAVLANSSMPTIQNPFDTLSIKIPGMQRFTDSIIMQDDQGRTIFQTNWIAEYMIGWYNYLIGIIGIIALVSIAIGGVLWVTSGGNPGKINNAKNWITNALFGLIVALLSYTILYLINADLVIWKPLKLVKVEEVPIVFTSGGGSFINVQQYGGKASIKNNVSDYDSLLKKYATQFNVDCTLAKAHMMAESGGRPSAVSSAGAQGLMQLMPATANGLGVTNPTDPEQSIMGGIKYMSQLKTTGCNGSASNSVCDTGGHIKYRIAAYNGGPGANKPSTTCGGITWWECPVNKDYAETRNYVNTVISNYNLMKQNGWGC
ncbi:MAG: lytic transglycosylase domain-containing protein [Patescibacteria group bacterium]|nr:lytic transglycosylase domain-containing protein [Patescibacteria group bacterium]